MHEGILDPELVRVAIVGGGPIGLEAALYARFLGYAAIVLEQQATIGAVDRQREPQDWAGSWSESTTPLGLAAIDSQSGRESSLAVSPPTTWSAYVAEYLGPLSQTDLVADSLKLGHRVVGVRPASDAELLSPAGDAELDEELNGPSLELPWGGLAPEDREWTDRPWCVTTVDLAGRTSESWFDCVIDASGTGSAGTGPDWSWYGDLPLTLDPTTLALPLLAACGLTAEHAVRWSDVSSQMPLGGGGALSLGHPGLFVLGSKSYGRTSQFQFVDGYAQIRELFAWLGGRGQLDLYRSVRR
ncbi:MAG: FAD/NAD(P)-binding oxidoreductase [Pirellulales bacterium]